MKKTLLIAGGVLVGSCVACGGALALLGLASDDDGARAIAGPPASSSGSADGEHPAELVGFWSSAAHKMALFPDGSMKGWYRHWWDGSYGSSTCSLEGDFTGTWSVEGDQLTVELTDGRWRDCNGEQDFTAKTESWQWRQEFASGIGKTVMWLEAEGRKTGYNRECERPQGCSFEPKPLP